jgi:plasmid maintenance system antidote protein VapI
MAPYIRPAVKRMSRERMLGVWFGTSAQFWLNLQSAYDIRVAEERAGREIAKLPTRPTDPALSLRKQQPTPP